MPSLQRTASSLRSSN